MSMKPAFFQLSEEKRATVLAAALAEFGRHDFDAASLDRIVAAAGISKGGLYEYIASKEGLYLHCMERAWDSLYQHIQEQVARSGERLPTDVLQRFRFVARLAIDWYLANPAMLGLIVRIARLPRDTLAERAQAVFERHFAEVFAGVETGRLAHPLGQVLDLIKWLLGRTRKDVLFAIEAGCPGEEIRQAYLGEWDFLCSVLTQGVYRPEAMTTG